MQILITGATGTVGGQVLDQLVDHGGHDLRALVRDPSKATLPPGVEVVQGDLTNPGDVRRALEGVDRAFLNMADDNGTVFASVAGEVGLGHVVLLSSFTTFTALPSGDANIVRARHRGGEEALAAAGVPSTSLRCAGFDYNIMMWAGDWAGGVVRAPYLDVPLPIVDPADIGAAVVAILVADAPKAGPVVITGPEKVTVRQQAQVLSEVLGQELRVEQISEDDAKRDTFPADTPDFVTTSVLETMGEAASVLEPSDGVQTLTGRAPRTFRNWAIDNAGAFA